MKKFKLEGSIIMKVTMLFSLALVLFLVLTGCMSTSPKDPSELNPAYRYGSRYPQLQYDIVITSDSIEPLSLEIPTGATVTWHNETSQQITLMSTDAQWDNTVLQPGDSFSHFFSTMGVYSFESSAGDMQGRIVVKSSNKIQESYKGNVTKTSQTGSCG